MTIDPTVLGDPFPGGWTVHTSLNPAVWPEFTETCQTYRDWPRAKRNALATACLRGVRYVSVTDPEQRVAGDWDWLSNRWRMYGLPIGVCDGYTEPDGPACDRELYARPDDVQIQCRCGGWTGVRAPGMRLPFD